MTKTQCNKATRKNVPRRSKSAERKDSSNIPERSSSGEVELRAHVDVAMVEGLRLGPFEGSMIENLRKKRMYSL